MRVGILGGTFDPPHIGHLIMAEEVYARLSLDIVLFVPAKEPPHKLGRPYSPIDNRLDMVKLAIKDNPHFALSLVDVERPGPSYSIDTVAILQREYGPQTELFFIVGLDSVADLLNWREPAKLVSMCSMVAVLRPDYTEFDLRTLEPQIPNASKRILMMEAPLIGVSSSDLRRRASQSSPIKYQVPATVESYIREHSLYNLQ